MGGEWTLGMVGPVRRAIMRYGVVVAVAESERSGQEVIDRLNDRQPGIAAVMRDEIEVLRNTLADEQESAEANMRAGVTSWVTGPMLAREDVIQRLGEIMKVERVDRLVRVTVARYGQPEKVDILAKPSNGQEHQIIPGQMTIRVDWA